MNVDISDVFGVNNKIVESTIERSEIVKEFRRGLKENKHIIIYGASKQGKSYLRKQYLDEEYILIDCGPQMTVRDIYTSIARQQNVQIIRSRSSSSGNIISVRARLNIPMIASGEAGGGAEDSQSESEQMEYLDYNLNNAQDLCELLKRFNLKKVIVLENFHYLKEKNQETLAFDLRTFNDHEFQFIILGVWRDQNRLTQYNGDLHGRIAEISVEPWSDEEFKQVAEKGCEALNINFTPSLLNALKRECFGSIGIFQELCKHISLENNIHNRQDNLTSIDENHKFNIALQKELKYFGQRHIKAFRSFVSRSKTDRRDKTSVALYVAKVILQSEFSKIINGIPRDYIEERIRKELPEGQGPSAGELGQLLHNILRHQTTRSINPPIFDYDETERILRIIDSTLFFYLKHNKHIILKSIIDI